MTIDKNSWGYNRKAHISDYLTTKELIDSLVQVVSKNGNLLLNVGPSADGTIAPIFADRLLGMGDWLRVNGAAIYASHPWAVCQNETDHSRANGDNITAVYYTTSDDRTRLYAIVTRWPAESVLRLRCPVPSSRTQVRMLGWSGNLDRPASPVAVTVRSSEAMRRRGAIRYSRPRGLAGELTGMDIAMPQLTPDEIPCQDAWVLEITGLANL